MQSKSPYLRFTFFTNSFQYNKQRDRGVDFVRKEHEILKESLMTDEGFLRIFGEGFPETTLHPIVNKERKTELPAAGHGFAPG